MQQILLFFQNKWWIDFQSLQSSRSFLARKRFVLEIVQMVMIFSRPIEQSFLARVKVEKVNTIKINYCNKNQGVVHFFSSLLIITTISIRNRALLKFFFHCKKRRKTPNQIAWHYTKGIFDFKAEKQHWWTFCFPINSFLVSFFLLCRWCSRARLSLESLPKYIHDHLNDVLKQEFWGSTISFGPIAS